MKFVYVLLFVVSQVFGSIFNQFQKRQECGKVKIQIVYFAYLSPTRDFKHIIQSQLEDLVATEILKCAKFNVVLSSHGGPQSQFHEEVERINMAIKIIEEFIPFSIKYELSVNIGNAYEYPGINKVWEIASSTKFDPNTIILYFHTKGMVFHEQQKRYDIPIFHTVIYPWRKLVQYFMKDKSVQRAGFASSPSGSVWFNFWWVRASYVRLLEAPQITENRFYYEGWIGHLSPRAEIQFLGRWSSFELNLRNPFPVWPMAHFPGPQDTLSMCFHQWTKNISLSGPVELRSKCDIDYETL